MSSFIAYAVTINRKNKTITFTGGDSNVVPRPRYKLDPIPFKACLQEIAGRCIQFSSGHDTCLFLQEIVDEILEDFPVGPEEKSWEVGLWGRMFNEDKQSDEIKAKIQQAVEKFTDACIKHKPDTDLYYLKREDPNRPDLYIERATSLKFWFGTQIIRAVKFKGYRKAKSYFASKHGFVPVKV